MTISAGTKMGPYEIVAPIGAGGMGEVWRARDPRLGRDVAIKVLPASFSADADRLRRFEQEARAAGVLNHPNITAVLDIGEHEGAPYVVQELLEGETLRQAMSGGLSPRKSIEYAIQIAHGLAAAHEKGIVHRDLKPENVFVTTEGRVKILDFGLAKLVEVSPEQLTAAPTASPGTEPGVVLGTIGYMSPEQIRGGNADHRSDIFSLGVILYEVVSGRRPFRGDSPVEIMSAILKEDPPALSESGRNVSPGLERLVSHCLEKAPARRFQSATDLAYGLESLSAVSGATSGSETPAPNLRRWRRLAAATALLAIGISAGWASHAMRPKLSPSYRRITFRRGSISGARFAPDGETIVYSAAWDGQPHRIFATRSGSTESRALQLPDAVLLDISATGELAIAVKSGPLGSTLARVALEGGAPREVLENVRRAEWSPDGHDLAVVRRVGARSRLEFPVGKVVYETGAGIGAARFSPSGDRFAVIEGGDTILLVDLAGKASILSRGWSSIDAIAWKPDGSEIWFSGTRSGKNALYAVTPSGRERLVRSEAGGLDLYDISGSGRVLVSNSLFTHNLAALPPGESSERDLSWMDRSIVCSISNDGASVVFDEGGEAGGESGAIYLRRTDGSPAIPLGEGMALALSPDGRWVLAQPLVPAEALETFVLIPTGPGESRHIRHQGITWSDSGSFFPEGRRIVFVGQAPGRGRRLYVQDLNADPRPISPEGLSSGVARISPDGRFVAAQGPDSRILMFPVDGSSPQPVSGALPGERPVLWSADGQTLYACKWGEVPTHIFKIHLTTGRRELWKDIAPADRTGVDEIGRVVMSPDARAYAYSYSRLLETLQVAEGLH